MEFVIFLVMLVLFFMTGSIAEKRHFSRIRKQEAELRDVMLVPVKRVPDGLIDGEYDSVLVRGGVVVGSDYFKSFIGGIRAIFGGQMRMYESLCERGRREAVLRLKQDALKRGSKLVLNVKIETSNLAGQVSGKPGCIEVFAYGTALIPK